MKPTILLLIGACLLLTAPWSSATPRALLQNPPGGSTLRLLQLALRLPIFGRLVQPSITLGRSPVAPQLHASYVACCTPQLIFQALPCTTQAV